MKLLDVLTAPWAIQPEKLVEIQAIYAAHLRGDKIDIAAVEQRLGRKLASEPKPYDIVDGVAVLPIEGVIAKRANMFMEISGGTSSELIARDLRTALANPQVHSIILAIDSPGGTVDGTQALTDAVYEARGKKPIVSLANGTMASAAYWIGSAAEQAYISDLTTIVGSIGVVARHVDVSGAEAKAGVKTTEISAGKYKRIASQYEPLSKEGRASIQELVDAQYSVFVDGVARNRGVSTERVLADMADGRTFVGRQAVDAGLVDGVATLGSLIDSLNAKRSGAAGAASRPTASKGASTMDRTQLEAEHPDLFKALRDEFTQAGATAERQRIQAVEGALIPGHESLIAGMKFDGKTSGGDAALAVNAAERKARVASAAAMAGDAPKPVQQLAAAAVDRPAVEVDKSLPVEERCKAAWEKDEKVRAEFTSLETYTAFTRANEAGNVRILTPRRA